VPPPCRFVLGNRDGLSFVRTGLAQGARIMLLPADGVSNTEMAVRVGRPRTVDHADDILNWVNRKKRQLWPLVVFLVLNITTMAPSRLTPQGLAAVPLGRGRRLGSRIPLVSFHSTIRTFNSTERSGQ
jgi:hypothetical protein